MTDTLTILRARGARLAKMVEPDGTIRAYDDAYRYDGATVAVPDLQRLAVILADLLAKPDCAVIRGALIGGPRVNGIRRLLHRQKDGDQPTVYHVEHSWLALDCDGAKCPEDFDRSDIAACAEQAIQGLPEAFRDANCVAVASGSHGLKPGIRMRLWCWLSRPMGTAELKRWLRDAPVDRGIFSPAQITYTAAPVFAAGRADHLPNRLVELPGERFVHPPSPEELAPPTREEPPATFANDDGRDREHGDRYVTRALDRAVLAILNAGEGNRHATIVHEACCLIRYVKAGHVRESEVRRLLAAAAERAGKDDTEEVEKAISWGFDNPNANPIPEGLRRAS